MNNVKPNHTDNYTIISNDTTLDGKISLMALCSYFQESAWHHAEHLGFGFDKLKESSQSWVLMKLFLEIETYPEWGQTITVNTWPTGIERIFARRDFRITDPNNRTLVSGVSWWMIIDTITRRPQTVDGVRDFNFLPKVLDVSPERIKIPETLLTLAIRQVEYQELDQLEHVNNTRYASWIMNAFGREWFREYALHSYYIEFLSEALGNDTIEIRAQTNDCIESTLAGIRQSDGKEIFKSKIGWRKIDTGGG